MALISVFPPTPNQKQIDLVCAVACWRRHCIGRPIVAGRVFISPMALSVCRGVPLAAIIPRYASEADIACRPVDQRIGRTFQ